MDIYTSAIVIRVCGAILQDEECIAMMNKFISAHPELWNEDIGE